MDGHNQDQRRINNNGPFWAGLGFGAYRFARNQIVRQMFPGFQDNFRWAARNFRANPHVAAGAGVMALGAWGVNRAINMGRNRRNTF